MDVTDSVLSSPFFGLTLTCVMWCLGRWISRRTGFILCNPLLIAVVGIAAVLLIFGIPVEQYDAGGDLFRVLLSPVTAVLALNIYGQREKLGRYFLPVLGGCLAGSAVSLGVILLACRLCGLDGTLTASILPKSCTTAIAVEISASRGGLIAVTAGCVMIAGVTGTVFAPLFAKWFRVDRAVAEGLAIGACSHALGTTKAMEIGRLQGAMSGIAICLCGIFSSILAMFL